MSYSTEPKIWILTDHTNGNTSQCEGVAQKLGNFERISVDGLKGDKLKQFVDKEILGSPEGQRHIIISAGPEAIYPAIALKKLAGDRVYNVKLGSISNRDSKNFDLVVRLEDPPFHDMPAAYHEKNMQTLGVAHKVTPERIEEGVKVWGDQFSLHKRPIFAVLLGGNIASETPQYNFTPKMAEKMAEEVNEFARKNHATIVVTNSRRTSPEATKAFSDKLDQPAYFYDHHEKNGENPYFGLLGIADGFIVTSDSMSMMSEACGTGKPVYYYPLPEIQLPLHHLVQNNLKEAGCIREFNKGIEFTPWTHQPLDDAGNVAAAIRTRMKKQAEKAAVPKELPQEKVSHRTVWVLIDDRDGNTSQCFGLAAKLSDDVHAVELSQMEGKQLKQFAQGLKDSPPDQRNILVSASSATVKTAQEIKKIAKDRVFSVKLSSLGVFDPPGFDMVVRPHPAPLGGVLTRFNERKIYTTGVPHKVTPEARELGKQQWEESFSHLAKPRIAVMLGGTTSMIKDIRPETARYMGEMLNAYAKHCGGSLIITNSRRTSNETLHAFMEEINVPCFVYDRHKDPVNPYFGILGVADEFVVTSDSMSMMCEACSTGKPVYCFPVPEVELKMHKILRHELEKNGCVREFGKDMEKPWNYIPLDTAGEIASAINDRMEKVHARSR